MAGRPTDSDSYSFGFVMSTAAEAPTPTRGRKRAASETADSAIVTTSARPAQSLRSKRVAGSTETSKIMQGTADNTQNSRPSSNAASLPAEADEENLGGRITAEIPVAVSGSNGHEAATGQNNGKDQASVAQRAAEKTAAESFDLAAANTEAASSGSASRHIESVEPERLQRTASLNDRPPQTLARGESARRLAAAASSGARLAAASAASGRSPGVRPPRAGMPSRTATSMADALNARFLTTVIPHSRAAAILARPCSACLAIVKGSSGGNLARHPCRISVGDDP